MDGTPAATYWYSRWLFERLLAGVYLIAFLSAAWQFVPLLGQRGLEPVGRWVANVPFLSSPSLFHLAPRDSVFRAAAWIGVALSIAALSSWPQRHSAILAAAIWALLWMLYLSFVNVGQTFYGFGWEMLLCEVGFFTIFIGASKAAPNTWVLWILRWTLFRLMFGAGLIKLRSDSCWADLTCLDFYFETQPMPNALSWFFHWMPRSLHTTGVAFNHVVELIVPFGLLLPQPFASVSALITIVFQLTLIVSGNLSWLNWLTIVLCVPIISDAWLAWLPLRPPAVLTGPSFQLTSYVLIAVVALLSVAPVRNLLSPTQAMNASFEPLHLVNTYGAFGSVTRERFEIVIEGTDDETLTPETRWREYEVPGKPGDPARRPPQIAPYHLRLGWLLWFEAMGPPPPSDWFLTLLTRLLEGDRATLSLLSGNPFPASPPRYVRAQYYRYQFTTPAERRSTGLWWKRQLLGTFYGPLSRGGAS